MNYTFGDYWEYSFPAPWTDIDLLYPTEYEDLYDDHEDFLYLEEEDDDNEDEDEEEENYSSHNEVSLEGSHQQRHKSKQDFNKFFEDLNYLVEEEKSDELSSSVDDNLLDVMLQNSVSDDDLSESAPLDEIEDDELSERAQTANHFEIKFRTTSGEGLLLWISRGKSLEKDFFALALSRGYIELSYNLGKQQEPFRLVSKVKVDDGKWHTLVVHRRKRLGILRIDSEVPIKGLSAKGAKSLNTNGKLWIGGTSKLPAGLPPSYYIGFRGCVESVQVDHRDLNLVNHIDSNQLKYCDKS